MMMQTDAVRAGLRCEGKNGEKAQCFHYAVMSAVRREAPPMPGLSTANT